MRVIQSEECQVQQDRPFKIQFLYPIADIDSTCKMLTRLQIASVAMGNRKPVYCPLAGVRKGTLTVMR